MVGLFVFGHGIQIDHLPVPWLDFASSRLPFGLFFLLDHRGIFHEGIFLARRLGIAVRRLQLLLNWVIVTTSLEDICLELWGEVQRTPSVVHDVDVLGLHEMVLRRGQHFKRVVVHLSLCVTFLIHHLLHCLENLFLQSILSQDVESTFAHLHFRLIENLVGLRGFVGLIQQGTLGLTQKEVPVGRNVKDLLGFLSRFLDRSLCLDLFCRLVEEPWHLLGGQLDWGLGPRVWQLIDLGFHFQICALEKLLRGVWKVVELLLVEDELLVVALEILIYILVLYRLFLALFHVDLRPNSHVFLVIRSQHIIKLNNT